MKKILAAILSTALLILIACSCVPAADSDTGNSTSGTTPSSNKPTYVTQEPQTLSFELVSAKIGYFQPDSDIYLRADNAPLADNFSIPAYTVTSLEQMQQFFAEFFPVSTLQYPSPLDPFLEIMTEEFFQSKILVLLYVGSSASGSTYGISKIEYLQDYLKLSVEELTPPDGAAVMSGWLLGACMDRSCAISTLCTTFVTPELQGDDIPKGAYYFKAQFCPYILEQSYEGYHYPGETVTIRIKNHTEYDLAMYINGEKKDIQKQASSDDASWIYTFEMPSENVTVEFRSDATA